MVIIRILFVFLAIVALILIAISFITGENVVKKYSKQIVIVSGAFILIVLAVYIALYLFSFTQ